MRAMPALGSATHAPTIMDKRAEYRGSPRFYLPGEHPATWRMRKSRDSIAALVDERLAFVSPETYVSACESLAYVERELAKFEAAEAEAKRREWIRFHDGRDREQYG